MKKFFEKFILAALIVVSVTNCGLFKRACKEKEITYGTSMMNSYVMEATRWQVDSICAADTLPNIDNWIINKFKDYESGEDIYKYMYIKSDGKNEVVYIIMGNKEPYNVSRRITK